MKTKCIAGTVKIRKASRHLWLGEPEDNSKEETQEQQPGTHADSYRCTIITEIQPPEFRKHKMYCSKCKMLDHCRHLKNGVLPCKALLLVEYQSGERAVV